MNISQYTQIIAVVVVWLIYIYGLFKVIRGRSANKWNIVLGFTFATLLIVYLTLNASTIAPTDFVQVMLTFGLVLATTLYAISAAKQADASVQMARETKDARFAALKPIVTIDWTSGERGRAISPYFKNIGLGPALNVKCYCTHTKFEFKGKQDRTTLEVGKREHITLLSEDFDFKDWAGFAINCDYQSIYGQNLRSILRFRTEQERHFEIIGIKGEDEP